VIGKLVFFPAFATLRLRVSRSLLLNYYLKTKAPDSYARWACFVRQSWEQKLCARPRPEIVNASRDETNAPQAEHRTISAAGCPLTFITYTIKLKTIRMMTHLKMKPTGCLPQLYFGFFGSSGPWLSIVFVAGALLPARALLKSSRALAITSGLMAPPASSSRNSASASFR